MTISFEQIIPFEQTSDGHALDRLLAKLVNEALNAEELQQLEQLLKKSPDARAHYLRHLDLHSCLSAHWGVVDSLALPTKKKSDPKLRRRSSDHGRFRPNAWATAATLAVVVLGAVIWQIVLSSKPQSFEVLVNHSEESYIPGQKLSQGTMSIASGDMTFKLASDVTIEASGATKFDLTNSMNLHLLGGMVTADAALMDGDGFTVHTSHATITDLGTRFGVKTRAETGTENYTDVVVFSGKVDVKNKSSHNSMVIPATYSKNQAVRINADGQQQRLTMVELNGLGRSLAASETENSNLIASISDNFGLAHNFAYYGIIRNSMKVGSPTFQQVLVHTFNTQRVFPPELAGADVVMTPSPLGESIDLRITLELTQPCAVYVIPDIRAAIPDWLRNNFIDTGIRLRTGPWKDPFAQKLMVTRDVQPDDKGRYYLIHSVWRKDVPAGFVELGPPHVAGSEIPNAMYGIAVKALPEPLTPAHPTRPAP